MFRKMYISLWDVETYEEVVMAVDRSGDIAKIERDLNRLWRASMTLGKMVQANNTLNDDLESLDKVYECSAKIPQDYFFDKMMALHENIYPSISSLNEKISAECERLNELLRIYKEEQEQWEKENG